jgi:signal transduction histidine kinase/FixJ family two-component response regulator
VVEHLLIVAVILQSIAVIYGLFLLGRREGATGAWVCLIGAMLSMLTWRIVVVSGYVPPPFFNPLIAIWGSTFMVGAMFLFGREVTARKRAEGERDALLESERAARVAAENASRAKDDFLGTLSHELRSPLAAILGWCAVLHRSRASQDELARGLDVIERNARAQARLVDDLLDVTRMRSGNLQLNVQVLALAGPVRDAVRAAEPLAAAKSLKLESCCDERAALVHGDPDRLQQVATNLLVNAIKFTPAGGRVSVAVEVRDDQVMLIVADSGEGMDADFLPEIFGRFRQADSSTTRRHGGLGLGLSIVDHLARMHGGRVTATSAGPGRGSTFTVTFPRAIADPHGSSSARPSDRGRAIPVSASMLRGVRVVLVDDEEDVRSAVTRVLEQHGALVAALPSAQGIREAIAGHKPHVLVLDVGMPLEDGYSLIRRIRSLAPVEGGSTPAISLTAHARDEDRMRALAAGFNEHLPKPIDVPRLVSAVWMLATKDERSEPAKQEPAQAGQLALHHSA